MLPDTRQLPNGELHHLVMTAIAIRPLTPSRWHAFEELFGARGACGGCWCMYWRVPRKAFEAQKGNGNRDAMHEIVAAKEKPGLLAYRGKQAVGWCSVAPRIDFPSIARSRLFKALVDDSNTWSVTCLFVHKDHRRSGVSRALLEGAIEYARKQKAQCLEGYPQEPRKDKVADAFAWTGIASAFAAAGFAEVARPSPTRPVMRIEL